VAAAIFPYTDEYARFDYGSHHPFQIKRLELTYCLCEAYGLFDLPGVRIVRTQPAREEDVLAVHSADYLAALRAVDAGLALPAFAAYGLGSGDNPAFPGVYEWSMLSTGASLQGARALGKGEADVAFNIAGGLHHAMRTRASGFCYINDPAVAISELVRRGERIAYVDIDAHHGDGVQAAFYDTDQVLTISFHESGLFLFPGTGMPEELGEGKGYGYAVNVPLPIGTDDETFLWALRRVVPPLVERFRPDTLVTQLGVDSLHTDPLAHLSLTVQGFAEAVGVFKGLAPKWLALGGGGYNMVNVARAWTAAWAVMNGVEITSKLPEAFVNHASALGLRFEALWDEPVRLTPIEKNQVRRSVEGVVAYVLERAVPRC